MILAPPCDFLLGLVHVLGLRWHDNIYLCLIPKVAPFVILQSGEDVVLFNDGREVVVALV
jgi:hypothetical protein